ncbi:MAG: retron St85 family RNA-directed DNA polymerase [Armatimonadota bacterium]
MASNWYSFYLSQLPALASIDDLSSATRLSVDLLQGLLDSSDWHNYKVFEIPKRSGGRRTICSPKKELAAVQVWILRHILESIHLPSCAKAFRRGHGLAGNVEPHCRSSYFLSLDLQDFFSSVPYPFVFGVYSALGYSREMSQCLTRLCTFAGALPQGGITSPALSNAVCIRLDRRMVACAGRLDVVYTRYADDLTFSGESPSRLISMRRLATQIIEDESFRVNPKKTRFSGPARRALITGLVIRNGSYGVPRESKRKVRAMLHRLYTQELTQLERVKLSRCVDGWLSYMHSVDLESFNKLLEYEQLLRNQAENANTLGRDGDAVN